MTLQKAAQNAIDVQDACNSSGVARSMVEAMDAVRAAGQSVNTHPIVFMFLYKLMALNGHEPLGEFERYSYAEQACRDIAGDVCPMGELDRIAEIDRA